MEDSSPYQGPGMEPEARRFLKKIMNSVSVGLIWLLINMTAGLFWGYGIIEKTITTRNILFYAWLLLSLGLLLFYLVKVWRRP